VFFCLVICLRLKSMMTPYRDRISLRFVFLFLVILVDLEVAELVRLFVGGDHAEPVTKVVLLQVLLGQVLQVPLGESDLGREGDLALLALDDQVAAKVLGLAVDLDAVLEEGLLLSEEKARRCRIKPTEEQEMKDERSAQVREGDPNLLRAALSREVVPTWGQGMLP